MPGILFLGFIGYLVAGLLAPKRPFVTGLLLGLVHAPHQRFHDLRHACASLLLAQGVPARVVMETTGHSQVALTLNAYAHVILELTGEAADRMGAVLGGIERTGSGQGST